MFDANQLFKQRLLAYFKETGRYLRFIFNGHIAVALLFFLAALSYYYQGWLATLPADFPTAFVVGILFGLVVLYSPVQTYLKEPDLVFLIAAEKKMTSYFRNALFYSYLMQLYIVIFLFAAVGPLYFATYPNISGRTYLLILVALLIFKGWNLIANWWMLKVHEKKTRYAEQVIRFILNFAVFYFIIEGEFLLAGVMTILFIALFLGVLTISRKRAGINWTLLIEKDQKRMYTFYRIANLFTDVPHLRNTTKKRHWLVSLLTNRIPLEKQRTYEYLYRITFIRSGDYLGMYIRLIIIGGLAIYFVPNMWLKVIFGLLFLYMSIFQMTTLYRHHRMLIWIDLYPVNLAERQKALLQFMTQLSMIQTIIFALIFLIQFNYQGAVILLGGGIVFTYLFINGYVRKKVTIAS